MVWVMLDINTSTFEQHTLLRCALSLLLDETPEEIAIAVSGNDAFRAHAARLATYVVPTSKTKNRVKSLQKLRVFGYESVDGYATEQAIAAGNWLCRNLTNTPPIDSAQ